MNPPAPPPDPAQALGRYGQPPAPEQGPDQLAQAAYHDAVANGGDGVAAFKQAWKRGVVDLTSRLDAGQQMPGEQNLVKVRQRLEQTAQLAPHVATAVAHEFMVQQAQQAGAGAPAGAPPPGVTGPPPPIPPTGVV